MPDWFNATIDWVLATWGQLPSKDALSLLVSLSSFVLASAGLIYTMRSKRRDATTAARNDLHSCISEVSKVRTEREAEQRELGDKFYSAENIPLRMTLNARTKLYLSKAVLLSTRYRKLDITSFENLLLGAALSDEGKYRASLEFYRRAVQTSADPADKATALRVYGRSLIASGRPRCGRWRMRKAAKLFSGLSTKRGYDDDIMNYEAADTYARLVQIQVRWNYRNKAAADLADFRRSILEIRDPRRRQSMEEVLQDITGSGPPSAAAPQTATPPAAPAAAAPPATAPAPEPATVDKTNTAASPPASPAPQ
jgi:tetratricopeptide (TPR) repeat protein